MTIDRTLNTGKRDGGLSAALALGTLYYCVASTLVVFGVSAGLWARDLGVAAEAPRIISQSNNRFVAALIGRHGHVYLSVAEDGYLSPGGERTNVFYFPAFALLTRVAADASGASCGVSALVASNVLFWITCCLTKAYVDQRFPNESRVTGFVLVMLTLFPTTIFFRMAHTESMFLLCTVLALFGIERRWSPLVVALVVGLATGTRPVGVALLLPLGVYLYRRHAKWGPRLTHLTWGLPVATWGLLAFMLYLQLKFDDPLTFATSQDLWRLRESPGLPAQLVSLATLEPIWSVYDSGSVANWQRHSEGLPACVSLQFANPVLFCLAAASLAVGGLKRWLNLPELLLGAGVLLIPYLTRSFEMCMIAQGRFASVCFPMYLVFGIGLARCSWICSAGLVAIAAAYLLIISFLLGAGYAIY